MKCVCRAFPICRRRPKIASATRRLVTPNPLRIPHLNLRFFLPSRDPLGRLGRSVIKAEFGMKYSKKGIEGVARTGKLALCRYGERAVYIVG